MPSTDPRHRGQRGVSLVESLVAAALLGLTVMTGMTAWDTAIMSGRQAVHEAWARCVARAEMEAVLNAPFSDNPTNYASPVGVTVSDQALLPDPYSRLGELSAALPVEPMYSTRNGRLNPARLSSPSLAAESKV